MLFTRNNILNIKTQMENKWVKRCTYCADMKR